MAFKDPEKAKAYYRAYEETHREQHATRQRAYYQRRAAKRRAEGLPVLTEEQRKADRARRCAPARVARTRELRRARRQDNVEYAKKHAELQRKYREKHPEARAADKALRRMRVTAAFTAEDRAESIAWRKLIKDDPCFYCGAAETHHVDHYISLANAGTEHWWNLVRACRTCNHRKNRMNGDEFLSLLGRTDTTRSA